MIWRVLCDLLDLVAQPPNLVRRYRQDPDQPAITSNQQQVAEQVSYATAACGRI
jgi:hypothetical protein